MRCREERDALVTMAALLERQVRELTAARDEAIIALLHAQATHESALTSEREKVGAAESS